MKWLDALRTRFALKGIMSGALTLSYIGSKYKNSRLVVLSKVVLELAKLDDLQLLVDAAEAVNAKMKREKGEDIKMPFLATDTQARLQ